MRFRKHFFKNSSLAAHLGGGASSQGGGEQGTGARGSHYLDGSPRSHTIAAKGIVFEVRSGPKHWPFLIPSLNKNSLTDCPYFRSKRIRDEKRTSLLCALCVPLRLLFFGFRGFGFRIFFSPHILRQRKIKRRPLAEFASCPHPASVALDDVFND